MEILVTGAAGYIGSVLVRQLLECGYKVRGFDNLRFGGDALVPFCSNRSFSFVRGDVRNTDDVKRAIDGVDAVVHLAAIVGDPACSAEKELATDTNWNGSKLLFDLCSESPTVKRFVFASTCSNYGKMEGDSLVTEESPLRPVSLYAELKVKFENYIQSSKPRNGCIATSLRFSTVYGLSPRMRFDLTVNEFTRDALLNSELQIFGEQFWRPYCHVEDLAASCKLVLESDARLVAQNVFNVGNSEENYQKRTLAELLQKELPELHVAYVKRTEDPRDYRVDFTKITTTLGFHITKRVPDGIQEILSTLRTGLISEPYSPRYKNT